MVPNGLVKIRGSFTSPKLIWFPKFDFVFAACEKNLKEKASFSHHKA